MKVRLAVPWVAAAVTLAAANPTPEAAAGTSLVDAFKCIHRHEGPWDANTGNGYFGGLQMDRAFMARYGWRLYRVKGTADRWTPAEQIRVAIVAHRTRGFWPWPNTARMCGLL